MRIKYTSKEKQIVKITGRTCSIAVKLPKRQHREHYVSEMKLPGSVLNEK